ncbi:hypothetical protein [Virgisporangium aurantiacum]|uniref:Uncharacterized protein n=1 Tax=Virgisporangium aurantiacum TaxID=175570 RepID=A0A8J4E6R1_9ACTN|nr:hypothetical protein [Virgisporangium aurantiacum]GIJ61092.1 hypothetical protein Vau01_086080 [Virgisporangium aurantiacum]
MGTGGGSTKLIAALRAAATPDLYRDRQDRRNHAVDDFFRLWPEQPGGGRDAGLAAFDAGDPERADAVWEAAGTDVAHHNLAVLNHMLALDADHAVRVAAAKWRRSYRYWRAIWLSPTFWHLYAARLAGPGEPAATVRDTTSPSRQTAATVREQLPLVLARIGARVALRWAERRQSAEMVQAHWQLVEYDGFPENVRAKARLAGADAVIALTRARLAHADGVARPSPRSGASIGRQVRDKVAPALDLLARARVKGADPVEDEVAEHMLRWTAAYVEATGNFVEGLRVLHMARDLSPGYKVGSRIDSLIDDLKRQRTQAERPGTSIVDMMTSSDGLPYGVGWPPHLQ